MIRFLRRRKDVLDADLPLLIYGAPLCGRCKEVKRLLQGYGLAVVPVHVDPSDLGAGLSRAEAATLLAVFTRQDGMLPAIIGADHASILWQSDVERFCATPGVGIPATEVRL